MRRRATLWAPAAVVLVGAVAVALLRPGAGAAFFGDPGGDARPTAGIRFVQSSPAAVVIDTPTYKLTIAKRNVELNRGTIDVRSQRNVGTTVTIRLPAGIG